jgi:hypothetical protein
MDRLEAFETMLADVLRREREEGAELERLRSEGRTRTATYRQLVANRLTYRAVLSLYEEYGLLDRNCRSE